MPRCSIHHLARRRGCCQTRPRGTAQEPLIAKRRPPKGYRQQGVAASGVRRRLPTSAPHLASNCKKGKKKGKTVALTDFLAEGVSTPGDGKTVLLTTSTSWADEVEGSDDFHVPRETIILPTAPKASRGLDLDKIPTQPPFMIHIANLSYELNPEEISRFFKGLKVADVKLPRDGGDSGRLRGYGYVYFEDRDSLIEALSMTDMTLKNRSVRIELATGEGDGRRQGYGRDRERDGPDRTDSNWRVGGGGPSQLPPAPASREYRNGGSFRGRGYDNYDSVDSRGGGGGGYGGGYRENRGYDNDFSRSRVPERGGYSDYGDRDRGRSGYGGDYGGMRRYQDGGPPSSYNYPSPYYSNHGPPYPSGGRGGSGYYSYDHHHSCQAQAPPPASSGYYSNRRRTDPVHQNGYPQPNSYGRDDRRRGFGPRSTSREGRGTPPPSSEPAKERPRIQLKPRTKPVVDEPVAPPSIFGGAKPVDTAAREMEILEKKGTAAVTPPVRGAEERGEGDGEESGSRQKRISERGTEEEEPEHKEREATPPADPAEAEEKHEPRRTPTAARAADIFGGARPVDTARREQEIWQKRAHDGSKEEEPTAPAESKERTHSGQSSDGNERLPPSGAYVPPRKVITLPKRDDRGPAPPSQGPRNDNRRSPTEDDVFSQGDPKHGRGGGRDREFSGGRGHPRGERRRSGEGPPKEKRGGNPGPPPLKKYEEEKPPNFAEKNVFDLLPVEEPGSEEDDGKASEE
ncbi:unnamed protein product [Cyprideis torosa]|uniref:Uncharacterized protein n=1 Tax=Cyprideis torosa TaxID=163714 RepID=A0A7R8ZGN6_9CRUS|nr:unnamed protein product [Cyprideis torosa]CAG0880577.1 unnamed protein product [Cyprideis torosa]